MKKFLFILSLLCIAALPAAASAKAGPNVSLSTTSNKRYINLSFKDLKSVSRVSYTLTYDTRTQQKGFVGGFKTSPKLISTTRRQILGTCSSGKCVYHQGVHNFQIEATFTLRSGDKSTVTKNLP